MASFLRHTKCKECSSSDGNAIYDDGSSYCFVCEHTVVSKEYLEDLKPKPRVRTSTQSKNEEKPTVNQTKESKPVMTKEEFDQIKTYTEIDVDYRGIRAETYRYFGVRHLLNDSDGEIEEQYYPITQEGELVGLKIREVPKNFRSIGRTGSECDLFMQHRFNRGGKYVLITEGEIDALSGYQMLNDYNKSRGMTFETAVVSATTGAKSVKQIANNYAFLDMFEVIVLCMDNDKAGKDAVDDLVKVLPKGKVRIMNMRRKDPNEYLKANAKDEFIADFYNAQNYTPVNVLGSGELYDKIVSQSKVAKVPFPPFMDKLNEMFAGGFPLGHIINIAAGTGLGKTSFVNELIYYWIFHSPHKIGIVSMELDAGQYGEVLLSRHLSRKLALIKEDTEKQKVLESDLVKSKASELFMNGEEHRFYLLDNRDGSIEEIQDTIEELVVSCGCKIVVLDPLQDILDGLTNDEQALFMKWSKGMIKSHGISFIFINHMRKSTDGNHTEEDIHGSSTIIKSASANILLKRDKVNDDEVIRNTTTVTLTKNRICGLTGPAGEVYYDNETHTLWDKDEYFNNH